MQSHPKEINAPQPDQTDFPTYASATRQPLSSRSGERKRIRYVVEGLQAEGAFSILAAKPKQGKSSLSRYIATRVASGSECLGRSTIRGQVLLVSLEDHPQHTDDSLEVFGWNRESDARIDILEALPYPTIAENIAFLEQGITDNPDIRLVIIDTLAKFMKVADLNDYTSVLHHVKALRDLAVRHPHVHIMGLCHSKKVETDNPFDSILGSTALRGETDTTIVLFEKNGQRLLTTETRRGRPIEPTILEVELFESADDGALLVKDFRLGVPFADWKQNSDAVVEKKQRVTHEQRIIDYLSGCDSNRATQQQVLDSVKGQTQRVLDAIKALTQQGVLTQSGTPHSKSEPITLQIDLEGLQTHVFTTRFGKGEVIQ